MKLRRMRWLVPLAFLLASGLAQSTSAHAQLAACRSDPVVTLSNLAVIDLQAGISDSLSDVKSVTYVVHGPKGTSKLAVVNTDTLIGLKESVSYVADDSSGTYDVYTTVYTGQSGVAVTAYTTVVSPLGLTLSSPTLSGKSGQTLHTHVGSLL